MKVNPESAEEEHQETRGGMDFGEARVKRPESKEERHVNETKYRHSVSVAGRAEAANSSSAVDCGGDVGDRRSLPLPSSQPWPTVHASELQLKPPIDREQAADQWCERNCTALFEACCNCDPAKATRILEQSSERQLAGRMTTFRDDFQDSALHVAAGSGQTKVVRQLLARGADVNAVNNLGSTPLNRAAVAGRVEVVEILLDAGANLEHQDDISGTPLHGAARRNLSKCCRVLLNRGALVDVSDGVGNTPLHLAAAEGAVSALQVLVKHNADPQIRNIRQQTPLDVARTSWIGSHCKEKIARILRCGAG